MNTLSDTVYSLLLLCLTYCTVIVSAEPCIECQYCTTDYCYSMCQKSCAVNSPSPSPSTPNAPPPNPSAPTSPSPSPSVADIPPSPSPNDAPNPPSPSHSVAPNAPSLSPSAPNPPSPSPSFAPALPSPSPSAPNPPSPSPSFAPDLPAPTPKFPSSPSPRPSVAENAAYPSPSVALDACKGYGTVVAPSVAQSACDTTLRYCEGPGPSDMIAVSAPFRTVSLTQCENIAFGVCQSLAKDSSNSPCGKSFGGYEQCNEDDFATFYKGEVDDRCEAKVRDIAP